MKKFLFAKYDFETSEGQERNKKYQVSFEGKWDVQVKLF
jgi:hypothetical protein